MTQDPTRMYRDWRAADEDGRDAAADAACRALFESVMPAQGVSAAFTARTMKAVADAAARDAKRSRQTRTSFLWGGLASGLVLAYFGLGLMVSLASSALGSVVGLFVGTVVRLASALQAGVGLWGVLTSMGSAALTFVSDPTVTLLMIAIQGVAVGALLWLQRLVDSDGELLK